MYVGMPTLCVYLGPKVARKGHKKVNLDGLSLKR